MAKIIDFQKERAERGKVMVEGYYIDPNKLNKEEIEALVWFSNRLITLLYFMTNKALHTT